MTTKARAIAKGVRTMVLPSGVLAVVVPFHLLSGPNKGKVYIWRGLMDAEHVQATTPALAMCGCPEDGSSLCGIEHNVVSVTLAEGSGRLVSAVSEHSSPFNRPGLSKAGAALRAAGKK